MGATAPVRRREWGRGSGTHHPDGDIAERDRLSGTDFRGLARFDRAVDRHHAAGDQPLAGAAAVGEPGELEQLVEFDELAARVEREVDALHAASVVRVKRFAARARPKAHTMRPAEPRLPHVRRP
jgi:hypothetical protein